MNILGFLSGLVGGLQITNLFYVVTALGLILTYVLASMTANISIRTVANVSERMGRELNKLSLASCVVHP